MKLLKSISRLQYLTFAYALLYILFFIDFNFGKPSYSLNAESIGVNICFVLFLIGFVFSWFNGIVTGVLFLLWNVVMWIVELFFVDKGGGFGIVSGVPLLILGVFYIIGEYKSRKDPPPTKSQQWKLALQILLTTYTILYFIFALSGFNTDHKADLLSWPGLILIFMIPVYLTGFFLSWKSEVAAGILFIIWYAVLLLPALKPIEYWMGPLQFLGIPVLLQGVIYIFLHSRLHRKTKTTHV
jgi:hypothetical protein